MWRCWLWWDGSTCTIFGLDSETCVYISQHTDDIFSLRDLQGATSGLLDHTYSLRFANNLEFRNETVLVYSGLPDSLLNSLSASQLDFACSSAPDDPSKSWLVSFSDNFPSYDSVGLRAPFLSVLYYYSTKTPRGFTMAITVSESNNGSLVGDEHNTVSCYDQKLVTLLKIIFSSTFLTPLIAS